MCGIAGWLGPEAGWNAEAFREGLRQRGPDGSGVWRSERATLVHTRLAILDLSEAGAQPMAGGKAESGNSEMLKSEVLQGRADRGSCVLAFNGEIYNFRELRAELEALGERFAGNSDTEVLLRLLMREGEACLPKLAGMFAFCFWDEDKGEALLARDAFGIKPLYYRVDGTTLAFASETRVLQRGGDGMDAAALRDYFLWGSVLEPATLSAAVRQLPAGHVLRWKRGMPEVEAWHEAAGGRHGGKGGKLKTESRGEDDRRPATRNGDWARVTRTALLESMRRHLVSDVPVGIFLSGGIDSTVVLALAREVLGKAADIRTFSIGFDDSEFDESGIARRTAEHFGARHTEWRMNAEEGAAEIEGFLAAMDQPSIDGFNTWCVSKLARREGMKVVLSGLGGDEFFAGYGSFERVPRFRSLHRILGPLRPALARMLETRAAGTPWRRLAAFLRGGGSWLDAYHAQRGIFTAEEAEALVFAFTETKPKPSPEEGKLPGWKGREMVSHLEVTRYMRNQLLRDSDVFSMAHGLELRVPLVDLRLAEALWGIPPDIRLRQGKQSLLEAVPEVPEWVWSQPKRGFRFPFQQWMESHFRGLMQAGEQISPVPLNAWYRTWAVVAAQIALSKDPFTDHTRRS